MNISVILRVSILSADSSFVKNFYNFECFMLRSRWVMFSTNVDTRMEYAPGDSILIKNIVSQLKSQGVFDQFRKECISDVDTKVRAFVNSILRVIKNRLV